jgi:hypothetical protein
MLHGEEGRGDLELKGSRGDTFLDGLNEEDEGEGVYRCITMGLEDQDDGLLEETLD